MKKISLIFILLVFAFQALSAKDLTGVKIYLNPGHGGFHAGANDETGRNDRNVPTIPFDALDENGFWESSCNLTKGLFLKDLLEKNGATVKISRTQNREIDDRDLKEISLEANGNDTLLD